MEKKSTKKTEKSLIKSIEDAGAKAFVESKSESTKSSDRIVQHRNDFYDLISHANTFHLIAALNILIKPGRVPSVLRPHLMETLTRLPRRPDGVRAVIEFVFAVHPSSTVKTSEAANPQKQGANITMEGLKVASNIISVPPADIEGAVWFRDIEPQLLALLDGKEGPDLVRVAAYIIGFGILGRRSLGSPGMPGWKQFARPVLQKINPSIDAASQITALEPNLPLSFIKDANDVVDVRREVVIVEADELSIALSRLSSLLNSHPNPGLTWRLLRPIISQLWALSSWLEQDGDVVEKYSRPAKTLLETALKLSKEDDCLRILIDDLLYKGQRSESLFRWIYERSQNGGIHILRLRSNHRPENYELDVAELEFKVNAFVQLLQSLNSDTEISALFLSLLQDSLPRREESQIRIRVDEELPRDPRIPLIKAKLLQKMLEVMPKRLVSDPKNLLDLVNKILVNFDVASGSDDSTTIALSLLNLVVTAPEFKKSEINSTVLATVETSLDNIIRAQDPDVSQTAHNISLLITYRDSIEDPSGQLSAPTEQQLDDRRTYNLAMQYITEPESPPPVRSEGLNLLSTLIQANSPILDIPTTLALLSSLLSEDEDYTNLRVMKLFTQLASRHPKSVTKEILEHYVDANEKANTDTRLRFGEALLQVIQRLGETFTGETATTVGESLLATAGRRGRRPRTEKRQEREARARAQKHKAASDAWGGEVPDLGGEDEDDDGRTAEERARDEAIAQIVGGWESRRGSEDVRVRASALSLFAAALETGAAGLGPALVEAAVDLCLGVLTLETGPGEGILRRAAVAVVLAFVRALADARGRGRRLAFGLADPGRADVARVLDYVARADGDGLVQHNAREAAESLRNWSLTAALVPPEAGTTGAADGPAAVAAAAAAATTLTRLAGLNVGGRPSLPPLRREGPSSEAARGRPRIEEVE